MVQTFFRTTRFKRGNFLFPAIIEISDNEVVRVKKYFFFKVRRRISIGEIGSLHIRNSQFSSELSFKDKSGGAMLAIIGIQKSEVHRIRQMLEKSMMR